VRRISFSYTRHAFLAGLKDVTRRKGWLDLKPGDRLLAVSKCMGLRHGEYAEVYGVIEVVSVRRERLDAIDADDVVREGFPGMTPGWFVGMFCGSFGASPNDVVTRIEFRRLP